MSKTKKDQSTIVDVQVGISNEVDITPEMIDAGVDVLLESDHGWSNLEQFAKKIFWSMVSASRDERLVSRLSR
jgi:hypothetical protein